MHYHTSREMSKVGGVGHGFVVGGLMNTCQ